MSVWLFSSVSVSVIIKYTVLCPLEKSLPFVTVLQSSSPEQVLDPSQPLPPRRAAANASKKMAAFTASSEAEPTTIVPSPSPSPGPSTAQPQSLGLLPISADIKAAFIRKEIVDCPYEVGGCC